MDIVLATGNENKVDEMGRILSPLGFNVISLKSLGFTLTDEENGATFAENAMIKAREAYRKTGMPVAADDSGLCVDYLGGEPGVLSARYGGEALPHSEKMQLVLKKLDGVPKDKRTARFICAIALILDNNRAIEVEEACEGFIGYEPRGGNGFGYDPIFMCGDKSFAELSDAEKDRISHRGKALKKLAESLQDLAPCKDY